MNQNNVTKFEWDATESAPKHYPMEIIRGTFIYQGELERGLYIPSGGTLTAGWGRAISSHVVGEQYKPLPDRLKITFFSYAEKQFYQGEFALPYEKILALFKTGVAANPEYPTASRIMVGVAPGGAVAVWVIGSGDYQEVFFGQAEKINLDPGAAFALPFKNKADSDAYIEEGLIEALKPEELESLKNNGIPFGLWARYRQRYSWYAKLSEPHHPDFLSVNYVNGEVERRWRDYDEAVENLPRTVPKKVTFHTVIDGKKKIFIIHFDENETMTAFEKLGANNQKIYLEFEPKLPKTQAKVRVYNDKKSIRLNKIISEDW